MSRCLVACLEPVADFVEQFHLGSGWFGFRFQAGLATFDQVIHRHDDHEVHSCSNDHERDDGINDGTDVEDGIVDRDGYCTEAGLTAEHGDEGVNDAADESVDHSGEGSAHNHRDGKVDDIAAHDELFEALNHWLFLPESILNVTHTMDENCRPTSRYRPTPI